VDPIPRISGWGSPARECIVELNGSECSPQASLPQEAIAPASLLVPIWCHEQAKTDEKSENRPKQNELDLAP